MENEPSANGIQNGLITRQARQAESKTLNFRDFNELASKQNYENLGELFASTLKKYPSMELPKGNLNMLGLQLIFHPKTSEQGINILLLATNIYPNSSNLFDSLAEAYLYVGNEEKAVENFDRSLELNSQNQNAIDRLKQLRK